MAIGFIASTQLFLLADPVKPWPLISFGARFDVYLRLFLHQAISRSLAHFWLGMSLLLAPLAAWIAIRGLEDLATPLVLGLAVCFWVAGFDII